MTKDKFSKIEVLKYGFEKFKANWQFLTIIGLIYFFINYDSKIFETTQKYLKYDLNLSFLFISILWAVSWIIKTVIDLGIINISLKFVENKKPKFSDLVYYRPILNYIAASILYFIIVFLGFILLIIPGVILAIRLQFYSYLIVEHNLGPLEALKKSWRITKGLNWDLFLLGLLILLLNIAGTLLFLIGTIVTAPITSLTMAKVYRKLNSS